MSGNDLYYSAKYCDDEYEYSARWKISQASSRIIILFSHEHVCLPKEMVKLLPMHLMSEEEWRQIGIQQSEGWIHYMRHKPEPHVLLFKRPINRQKNEK